MASISWEALTGGIGEAFSSDCVDVEHMKKLMAAYKSSKEDWEEFAKFDQSKPHTYTRNLVDKGNGKYNLIVLYWPGKGHNSGIHNHADSHCFMKVLSGTLKETSFKRPDESAGERPMQKTKSESLYIDEVTYIDDSIGLHCVENPETDPAVSLHLYWPPFTLCKRFEEKTGQAEDCEVSNYYSEYGKVPPRN